METTKDLGKDFPSVLDRAYTQYKRERAQYRKVIEIMSREVVTTTPETKLDEAARLMGEKHIGSLIVVAYNTPVGILTERDLLSKVFLSKKDSSKERIEKLEKEAPRKSDLEYELWHIRKEIEELIETGDDEDKRLEDLKDEIEMVLCRY